MGNCSDNQGFTSDGYKTYGTRLSGIKPRAPQAAGEGRTHGTEGIAKKMEVKIPIDPTYKYLLSLQQGADNTRPTNGARNNDNRVRE